jgi:hypothetical protein
MVHWTISFASRQTAPRGVLKLSSGRKKHVLVKPI